MDGTIITKRGMQLLVKLMATKGVLNFTRVSVGTGSIPSGYDPASMIELVQYRMDGMISKCSAEEDVARITMQISSAGIETGFIMTEMGVFAADPDIGEILYAYLDMKDDPQYIYAEGGETQKFVETTLEVTIESSTKVSTYINPSSLITKEEFDKEVEKIINPEFDDAGETEEIKSFPDFIAKVKSKMNIFDFFRNLKAGLKFVLHTGQIVNNCVSDNAELPLSAAQGKVLMDLLNQTNSNFQLSNAISFLAAYSDSNPEFLRVQKDSSTFYQLVTSKTGLKFESSVNSKVTKLWEVATKSDLAFNKIGNVTYVNPSCELTEYAGYMFGGLVFVKGTIKFKNAITAHNTFITFPISSIDSAIDIACRLSGTEEVVSLYVLNGHLCSRQNIDANKEARFSMVYMKS